VLALLLDVEACLCFSCRFALDSGRVVGFLKAPSWVVWEAEDVDLRYAGPRLSLDCVLESGGLAPLEARAATATLFLLAEAFVGRETDVKDGCWRN
jgi:hypothetical protein